MNYQELRDYALQCSLEHHLCNVEELLDDGETVGTILTLVEIASPSVVVWETYEFHETPSLVEAIEDMRGVNLHEFMYVLGAVNGDEWSATFKGAE